MKKKHIFQLQRLLTAAFFVVVTPLCASPWMETDDVYLRSDLQLLADAGVVTVHSVWLWHLPVQCLWSPLATLARSAFCRPA